MVGKRYTVKLERILSLTGEQTAHYHAFMMRLRMNYTPRTLDEIITGNGKYESGHKDSE